MERTDFLRRLADVTSGLSSVLAETTGTWVMGTTIEASKNASHDRLALSTPRVFELLCYFVLVCHIGNTYRSKWKLLRRADWRFLTARERKRTLRSAALGLAIKCSTFVMELRFRRW
jgi:hypothetical protein